MYYIGYTQVYVGEKWEMMIFIKEKLFLYLW